MITAYRLLSYNLPHNLEETINNYIEQGWQPFGSPFVDGDHYYQAIVQSEAPKMNVNEPVYTTTKVGKQLFTVEGRDTIVTWDGTKTNMNPEGEPNA
jgi:hypothetical protein